MNGKRKILSLTAGLCLCLTSQAETASFNDPADWSSRKALKSDGNGVMSIDLAGPMLSEKTMKLDPSKTYFISGNIKAAANSPKGRIFYGFRVLDENGKQLQIHFCKFIAKSQTELLEDIKPSDVSIKVKNASKWSIHPHMVIAYNAKEDLSDLPNRNIIPVNPVKTERTKDGWIIHLSKPVNKALPAGTSIREHVRGGEFYCANGNESKPVSLKKSRISFWKGVSQVRLLVAAYPSVPKTAMKLELSDLKVEAE